MSIFQWKADLNRHITFSPKEAEAFSGPLKARGQPLATSWKPLETVITPGGRRASMRSGDLPSFGSNWPILSARAVQALEEFLQPSGELLELQPPPGAEGVFRLFNVTRVIDAIDRENSDADWVEGGGIWNFRRLAFKPEVIAGVPLFRSKWLPSVLMVQTPFVERVTEAGLQGFAFTPLWPEQGPELFPNAPVSRRTKHS